MDKICLELPSTNPTAGPGFGVGGMSSSIANTDLAHAIATSVFNIRVSHCTLIAGVVIWAYDILLTLDDEISLLWARGGHLVKTLYLLNRYLPLLGLSTMLADLPGHVGPVLSVNACKIHFIIITVCQMTGIIVATTIFTVRLYTIYNGHRTVQLSLVFLATGSHMSVLTCGTILIVQVYRTMGYSEALASCTATPSPALGGIYVTPILLESVIAFATLGHAVTFRRHQRTLQQVSTTMNVTNSLYVDGVMYYLIVLSLRIGTCLVYWTAPPSLILLLCYLEYSLTSVVTFRWFLSFRRVIMHSLSPGPSTYDSNSAMTRMTGAIIDFNPGESTGLEDLSRSGRSMGSPIEEGGYARSFVETWKGPPHDWSAHPSHAVA